MCVLLHRHEKGNWSKLPEYLFALYVAYTESEEMEITVNRWRKVLRFFSVVIAFVVVVVVLLNWNIFALVVDLFTHLFIFRLTNEHKFWFFLSFSNSNQFTFKFFFWTSFHEWWKLQLTHIHSKIGFGVQIEPRIEKHKI